MSHAAYVCAFIPVNGLEMTACHRPPSLTDNLRIAKGLTEFIDARAEHWRGDRHCSGVMPCSPAFRNFAFAPHLLQQGALMLAMLFCLDDQRLEARILAYA
jgi:hypothetical protein